MLKHVQRLKAKQAAKVFANGQPSNGSEANAPNGKARSEPSHPKCLPLGRSEPTSNGQTTQGQSSNGSNGQSQSEWSERNGPITKIVRYGKHHFVQILQTTVRDNRLSLAARGLLAYLLSLPKGWQPHPKSLRKDLGASTHEWNKGMRELSAFGYAHLRQEKTGRRWEVCEYPKWGKATMRNSHDAEFAAYKNERVIKNERRVVRGGGKLRVLQSVSVERKIKGCERGESRSRSSFVFKGPKVPYPESEEEMYETLEAMGIDNDPEYDGSFFMQMEASGWTIRGEPVWDWPAAYEARLQVTSPKFSCA